MDITTTPVLHSILRSTHILLDYPYDPYSYAYNPYEYSGSVLILFDNFNHKIGYSEYPYGYYDYSSIALYLR